MNKFLFLLVFTAAYVAATSFRWSSAPTSNDEPVSELKRPPYKTKHVIVLVIDGPRFTETYGDTACRYIPHLGKELIHEGVLFNNFKNNGTTETNSGHVAMVTGVYDKVSNNGKQIPKNPTMFQYYLKASGVDKTEAWVVTSKGKLEILANCKDKKWWNMYMPSTHNGPNGNSAEYDADAPTFERVKKVITEYTPNLMLINLAATDLRAHEGNWEGYLQALRSCDQYAYDLWQFIQDNKEMKNSTTLFITHDHGRHLDGHKNGFVNHGDGCEGCRKIALLAIGPDFKKDVIITDAGETLDISKTISKLLGFDMPTSKGRVLEELFK